MSHQEKKGTTRFYFLAKRFIDILFSLIALILTLPLILLVCVATILESKGSPIFLQTRLGKDGKLFKLVKLRSMYSPRARTCTNLANEWTAINDIRITPTGYFIRKYHIDELPQLINVILGHMSVVGPRPELPQLTDQFEEQYPGFKDRLAVLPGLTGWAQINGGYNIPPDIKAEYDRYYIRNQSLRFDFKIMYKTIDVLFTGRDAR